MKKEKSRFNSNPADLFDLSHCEICPRRCGSNRLMGQYGFCRCDASLCVHSVVLHHGEEPVISGEKGISNVFFGHCNLQCQFCQNYQISQNSNSPTKQMDLIEVIAAIQTHLESGVKNVGFVSPSHLIPQMCAIMDALETNGYQPTYVMNSNGYDQVDVLRKLASRINVYLPDFKYMDKKLASQWSGAENYPEIARQALHEMFQQKGSQLTCDSTHRAVDGMIIRHLVLPGYIQNTLECLRFIAHELSPEVHVSIMSQYHPNHRDLTAPLNRVLQPQEYEQVINEMTKLGLDNGWVQALESAPLWLPDFDLDNPFQHE